MEKNVKLKDLYTSYDSMDSKRVLEESLREAACIGDTDAVQELVNLGVDVNTRHSVNGWTPLHWACKRGYLDVATLLLKNGADKNIRSEIGETPVSLCTNPQILQLLSTTDQRVSNDTALHNLVSNYVKNDYLNTTAETTHSSGKQISFDDPKSGPLPHELVLKIRLANSPDPDFVEVELPQHDLTYEGLVRICCKEFELNPDQVLKIRKLPNTKLRKDKDIQRLQNFQEIEIVTDSGGTYKYTQNSNGVQNTLPTAAVNGYQSMSKKDQVILY